jgi:PBP1b-binding outer membrane lipoprotein LpoB
MKRSHSMSLFLLFIFLVGCSNIKTAEESGEKKTSDQTQTAVEATSSPKLAPVIVFDRITYDFGTIPQKGGTVETTFEVKNGGSEALEIGAISTSCGCTSATISSTTVQPGDKATLTVFFDPDFHQEPAGKFTRTVYIPSNDPITPEAEVKIEVAILGE